MTGSSIVPGVQTLKTVEIDEVMDIHRYKRPKGSRTEQAFVDAHLKPLGVESDAWGNLHLVIGENPSILWSSHTDTVHTMDGYQRVVVDGNYVLGLHKDEKANCLGADDGAGVWLMMEMIRAKKPGHYIFHYGEERGCEGSTLLAKNAPDILKNIKIAMAFDRKGMGDVITRMGGDRVCSDAFADSLIKQLPLGYSKCTFGSRTDVKLYEKLIPECVNISVGYDNPHSNRETLSLRHLFKLRDALLAMKVEDLVVARDPTKTDHLYGGHGGYHGAYGGTGRGYVAPPKNEQETYTIHGLFNNAPSTMAEIFQAAGVNFEYLLSLVLQYQNENPKKTYTDYNKKILPPKGYKDPREAAPEEPKTEAKTEAPTVNPPPPAAVSGTAGSGKDVAPHHIPNRGSGAPHAFARAVSTK